MKYSPSSKKDFFQILDASPIVYVEAFGRILLSTFDLKSVVSEPKTSPRTVFPNISVSGASIITLATAVSSMLEPASTITIFVALISVLLPESTTVSEPAFMFIFPVPTFKK